MIFQSIDFLTNLEIFHPVAIAVDETTAILGYSLACYSSGEPVLLGQRISKKEAVSEFLWWIKQTAEPSINELVTAPLTQGMFDALVCLVHDIGYQEFKNSDLLKKLNEQDYIGAWKSFHLFPMPKGITCCFRRRAEAELFIGLRRS